MQDSACVWIRLNLQLSLAFLSGFSIFGRGESEDTANEAWKEEGDAALLTAEEIEQCLYSLADHNTYLRFNKGPCDRMIE